MPHGQKNRNREAIIFNTDKNIQEKGRREEGFWFITQDFKYWQIDISKETAEELVTMGYHCILFEWPKFGTLTTFLTVTF